MTVRASIDAELSRLQLLPLNAEQVQCLDDPARLDEAAAMLSDLRDRCAVRLPLPQGADLAGPLGSEDEAREVAQSRASEHPVVVVDEMATDSSRSMGGGNEFYVTAFAGEAAALALAEADNYVALWAGGQERL